MNSLIVLVFALAVFAWGYFVYARRLERLWHIDPKRSTPAYAKYDSIDYIPAKNWLVLFGHHFSSIAGAGPIIGPVIAVMLWGWLPALLWVLAGTVFIGGVHDFGSLITSVREGGFSVADIAGEAISRKAKIIFSLFVWLALILVIAVFVSYCAETFVQEPKVVLPSLGLIPVALLVGYFLYTRRLNSVLVTIAGLGFLAILLFLGNFYQIPGSLVFWIIILFAYCYIASILPVNVLLQPRDYLSSFLLFFGLLAGCLGLLVSRPTMQMPYFHSFRSPEGPLWPAMFVTVACGAISGFHALIASGTTSKQIASERHVKRVGYGGMVMEGIVAVLAIICVAAFFGPGENFPALLKDKGPIGIFSQGYGLLTNRLFGNYGAFVAVTVLNAFILTTLDTATRIARYLSEELFCIKNRHLSTVLVISASAALALSRKHAMIWPVFGASNQLVAALALFVLSCWLMAKHKKGRVILLPAFFMLITTVVALVFQAKKYLMQGHLLLCAVDFALILLALFMFGEVVRALFRKGVAHA